MMRWGLALLISLTLPVLPLWAEEALPSINLQTIVDSIQSLGEATAPEETPKKIRQSEQLIKIVVRGNKSISTSDILAEVTLKAGDVLTPYKIRRNVRNIRGLGVFEEVRSEVKKSQKGQTLIFTVIENPVIGEVQYKGAKLFETDILDSEIKSKKGDLLNRNQVRKDIQSIQDLYKDEGFSQAQVFGVTVPEKDGDPLIFSLGEGILEAVIVTGNKRTREYVILREMDLMVGKPINDDLLREDLRRIYNLNFFSDLVPNLTQGSSPDSRVLTIELTEKASGSINFGGGYSQTSKFFGFSDLHLDNFLGTGQLLALRGKFGINNSYEFKYHNPWMWEKRKSLTTRLWHRTGDFDFLAAANDISFRDQVSTGGDVSIGWPLSYQLRTWHTFKYDNVKINPNASQGIVERRYSIQSYSFRIAHDTRDFWFNPLEGHLVSFSVEKGLPIRDNALNFEQFDLVLKRFFPTWERQTIATRLEFGYIAGRSEADLADTIVYTVGGINTVRGYPDLDPVSSGTKRILSSIEYRLGFNEMFQAVFFIDAGYATSNTDILDLSQFSIGKGFGMRINTPLGPFRLDFGKGDGRDDSDGRPIGWVTHFSIGHAF